MKRIEVTQSGKGMKKELNPLGESENFVMLYSVRKIVFAYVDHTLIIQRSGKKDRYLKPIVIHNNQELLKYRIDFKNLGCATNFIISNILNS